MYDHQSIWSDTRRQSPLCVARDVAVVGDAGPGPALIVTDSELWLILSLSLSLLLWPLARLRLRSALCTPSRLRSLIQTLVTVATGPHDPPHSLRGVITRIVCMLKKASFEVQIWSLNHEWHWCGWFKIWDPWCWWCREWQHRRWWGIYDVHHLYKTPRPQFQEMVRPQVPSASAFSLVRSNERISPPFIPSTSAGIRQIYQWFNGLFT